MADHNHGDTADGDVTTVLYGPPKISPTLVAFLQLPGISHTGLFTPLTLFRADACYAGGATVPANATC